MPNDPKPVLATLEPPSEAVVVPERRPHDIAYWILFTAIFFLTLSVFVPLWRPLLFALVFVTSLRRPYEAFASRLGDRRQLAAGLLTAAIVLVVAAPLATALVIAARQAEQAFAVVATALQRGGLDELATTLPSELARLATPLIDLMPKDLRGLVSSSTGSWATDTLWQGVTAVSSFAFEFTMMVIAMHCLFADGPRLVAWLTHVSPIGRDQTQELLHEFRTVSRSLVGANVVTGGVQATLATIGYVVAGVPQPVFFGTLTLLTSFIPSVGTAIVAIPVCGLLFLLGDKLEAGLLAGWAVLVVGGADNVLRPFLVKDGLHVHGVLIFFSLIGAMAWFGLAGLIVGPMALVLFLTMLRFRDRDRARRLIVPSREARLAVDPLGSAADAGPVKMTMERPPDATS